MPDRGSPAASGRHVPRVTFEALPGELQDVFRPRYERLGYLGEFFQVAAHQPQALLAFHRFTESLKAALGDRFSELVALTVSSRLGNEYERNQHEQLAAKLGFPPAWIAEALTGDPDGAVVLGEVERTVQALAVAAADEQPADHAVDRAIAAVGAETTMAVLLLVGRYLAHASVVRALSISPPVAPVVSAP